MTKRKLAAYIVDLFDELLTEKNIEIPCSDYDEERDRHNDGNCASIYGMEYWNLVNRVEEMLVNSEE